MRALLLLIFLINIPSGGIKTITRLNQYTADAAVAYQQQDYAKAITAYEYILNDLKIEDDQLQLNLAHAYFKANLLEQAQEQYTLLAEHNSSYIQAIVQLQLGNIAARNHKYKKALTLYKKALVADPENDAARYNYELLKKYLALHPEKAEAEDEANTDVPDLNSTPPPAEQDLQNKQNPDAAGNEQAETDTQEADDQGEQQGQASQETGNREREQAAGDEVGNEQGQNTDGHAGPEQPQPQGSSQNISEGDTRARMQRERLREANLSPDKAKLLLDAMRNSELQYIQQLPKKATKKPKKGTPDW